MLTYFCDGIKQVTLFNGVARFEFFRFQTRNNESGEPDAQPLTELIIAVPPQGLLQAITTLEQLRDKLVTASTESFA